MASPLSSLLLLLALPQLVSPDVCLNTGTCRCETATSIIDLSPGRDYVAELPDFAGPKATFNPCVAVDVNAPGWGECHNTILCVEAAPKCGYFTYAAGFVDTAQWVNSTTVRYTAENQMCQKQQVTMTTEVSLKCDLHQEENAVGGDPFAEGVDGQYDLNLVHHIIIHTAAACTSRDIQTLYREPVSLEQSYGETNCSFNTANTRYTFVPTTATDPSLCYRYTISCNKVYIETICPRLTWRNGDITEFDISDTIVMANLSAIVVPTLQLSKDNSFELYIIMGNWTGALRPIVEKTVAGLSEIHVVHIATTSGVYVPAEMPHKSTWAYWVLGVGGVVLVAGCSATMASLLIRKVNTQQDTSYSALKFTQTNDYIVNEAY